MIVVVRAACASTVLAQVAAALAALTQPKFRPSPVSAALAPAPAPAPSATTHQPQKDEDLARDTERWGVLHTELAGRGIKAKVEVGRRGRRGTADTFSGSSLEQVC